MYGYPAEEDEEHEQPLKVFGEGREERTFASAIAESRESDIAEAIEDDDESDPDVPGVDVVFIDICGRSLSAF